MMSKSRSPLARGWRALYLLPLVCLGIGLQARTVYVPSDKDSEKNQAEEQINYFLPEVVVMKYADASVKSEDVIHVNRVNEIKMTAGKNFDTAPECSENFSFWLNSRLRYPADCLYDGTLVAMFVIGEDGKVAEVMIVSGLCEELDKAVADLIGKSPVWTPAKKDGKPVATVLFQPVVFRIQTPNDSAPAKSFVLKISPDGTIENNGKKLAVSELKDYIKAAGEVTYQTTVFINAAADTPMRVVDDVKNELRGVNALKVFYVKPGTGTGVSRRLAPERDFEGKLIQKSPAYPPEYPEEIREHMCLVAINGNDKVFFENAAYDDDGKMLEAGKAFVRKHGRKSIFLLRYENATSYSVYQHMQEVLRKVYDDLRDERAQALYGKSLASLSETELDDIYKQIPLNIVEATKD